MKDQENNTWIDRLKKRDTRGFSWLYDNYSCILLGAIMRIVEDKPIAENLLQDTFVKIWRNIDDFDTQRGTLFTWIFNIARNTAIDYKRSKAHNQFLKNQNIENLVHIESIYHTHININIIGIKDIVLKLNKENRDVIDLIYFNGYTQEEASETLNIPLGTVKTRVRIAIRELRKMV
jgi:RNA polymerase sigma-70 factor, ECF subfamily